MMHMPVTQVFKIPDEPRYAIFTQKPMVIGGKEVTLEISVMGRNDEERGPIAVYQNLRAPFDQVGGPVYFSQQELLSDLAEAGVKPEEIKELKERMF
jgi:hypothetical protein